MLTCRNAVPQANHTLSLNVDGTCQGLSETSPPSLKRTLAAATTTAAAAARAHQIPHTYLHAPYAMVRPGFIVTDVRLQGECFVMRREPLSAKEGIGGCKQSDRQGGASPTVRGSPDFSALTWPGPGPDMPLWQRLLIDGVCGGESSNSSCNGSVARKNVITNRCAITVLSFSSGWSVRLAVCGTRRAEYAKPF